MTSSASIFSPPAATSDSALACPLCGQLHRRVRLRPGDTSKCIRCDTQLARGRASNWIVTFAWVLTGLILWVPANLLPIVAVSRFGSSHESRLITGVVSLWHDGMPWVAGLVLLCGIAAPLLLLLTLMIVMVPIILNRPTNRVRFLVRGVRVLELWSIPEVYLLAVLVAFIKLDVFVQADPAPGLWCHAAMSVALVVAWRRFDIDAAAEVLTTERIKGGVT